MCNAIIMEGAGWVIDEVLAHFTTCNTVVLVV